MHDRFRIQLNLISWLLMIISLNPNSLELPLIILWIIIFLITVILILMLMIFINNFKKKNLL
ncbi:hypothetical protein NEF87_002102 [Candidatus Lokiarchaeum ossiferum]|uniref:Uncharacterized protein n=1 Tax=Candidatus Lokiarchaeum ossiferum TaxID=2951803 RepID=A0ABY6HTZ5_9ARCH|nr:hypothetical protein NEF87_002102 [Candidatus Lokiarchaeum sp. B-35]